MSEAEMIEALKELDEERKRDIVDRQVVNNMRIDFSKVRATDMKFNTKVYPPVEATVKSEAAILVQSDAIRRSITEYIRENDVTSILTHCEQEGRQSIVNRVKAGEIMITFTDKDSKVVVESLRSI